MMMMMAAVAVVRGVHRHAHTHTGGRMEGERVGACRGEGLLVVEKLDLLRSAQPSDSPANFHGICTIVLVRVDTAYISVNR